MSKINNFSRKIFFNYVNIVYSYIRPLKINSILDMDDSWFFFAVREDRLQDINVGATVQVRIPALGEQTYSGTVRKVQAMASYATWRATKTNGQYDVKSFDVKVVPLEHIEGLKPGMTAILEQ